MQRIRLKSGMPDSGDANGGRDDGQLKGDHVARRHAGGDAVERGERHQTEHIGGAHQRERVGKGGNHHADAALPTQRGERDIDWTQLFIVARNDNVWIAGVAFRRHAWRLQ